MAADKLRLPIGIQTFHDIREGGCYYVDKTEYALRAAADDKFLFLSRPRRFGKSLFLDTLAELYQGRETLFRGLAAGGRWDWSRSHPVVRLNFGLDDFTEKGMVRQHILGALDEIGRQAGIESRHDMTGLRLQHLLAELRQRTGQRAVVLVDEYDKPILDALGDRDTAEVNRSHLRGLFGAVKGCDAHIEKCFVTGICRFPRTSLFSTANQFTDRTLDPRYNAACGFTDDELDAVFAPELEGLDRDAIRQRYNGYSWVGEGSETVYNPYDAMLLFDTRRFADHWWRTGTPSFLVQHLERHGLLEIGDLDGRWVEEERLSDFDVERMDAAAVMFQTGNLTIGRSERRSGRSGYTLAYPNEEVRHGMGWLMTLHAIGDSDLVATCGEDLHEAVANADLELMEATMRTFYSSLPAPAASRRGAARSAVRGGLAGAGDGRRRPLEFRGEHGAGALGRDPRRRRPRVRVRVQDERAGRPPGTGRPQGLCGQVRPSRRQRLRRGGDDGPGHAQRRAVRDRRPFLSRDLAPAR